MKSCVLALLLSLPSLGQQSSTTPVTYDINGNRVAGPQVDTVQRDGVVESTERAQSINGRLVPLERIEERVVRSDSQGRVVERTVRRFDPSGHPLPPEKTLVEETKRGDGGATIRTTTWRADLNGNMAPVERSVEQVTKTGSGAVSDVVIERPSINGSFSVAEKRATSVTKTPAGQAEDMVVYSRDENGQLLETARETRETRKVNGETVDNTAFYERGGTNGSLQLARQTVRSTVANSDGSRSTQLDVYRSNVPGTVGSGSSGLKLEEQQLIERRPTAGGFVESVVVRRPSVSDPTRLGAAQKIGEIVCRGKCAEPVTPVETAVKPAQP